ncbi:GLPGLI family protein [Subsaxibacter sp. CAU 1640]|uniref:GLPGLI family protein n=1 Tax=Subsaxibacter sp. CAU 1640 TaxID=2933271 RepID=UPI002004ACE9|nr:GLPGLI family protein [Subsaxibacter sp. CAU 1640]MCK7590376.1 GLPGLI family protein [Subsaxibacter sp. CAU 1640]
MKTILGIAIMVLATSITTVHAQNFQGVATYKSHRKVDLKMEENDENSKLKEQLQEQLKKQFQREYTLTFDQNASTYKQNEQLAAPAPANNSGITITVGGGSDVMYKNIKEKRYTNQTEIFGKLFLIKDSLSPENWELVNETKNIGVYTCFKAVKKEDVTSQTLTSDGGIEKVTKEKITTAWYTPQIPINNGPDDFHGLPGLILEINDGELTLVCTKIILNPDEKIEIIEPKKGKEVTQKEFEDTLEKKNKEMMENFNSGRRDDGGAVIMKIGG